MPTQITIIDLHEGPRPEADWPVVCEYILRRQ